jgi:hypothetical protein
MGTTYSPKIRVTIKDLQAGVAKPQWGDISADVMSISTTKALGRCSGTWQMMLSYRVIQEGKRYDSLIFPNDIIVIEMDAGIGGGQNVVMLGLVDRVSGFKSINAQGQPTRQVKLSGRDMGKLLEDHDIGWDILQLKTEIVLEQGTEHGPPKPKLMKPISRVWDVSYQRGTPAEFVKNLYDLTFKAEVNSSKYYELSNATDDKWFRNNPMFGSLQGRTIWSAMKEVEHHPYNILHGDTVSVSKFGVGLKKQPFTPKGKLDLPADKFHTISDAEVVSEDTGISDSERINFLFFNPQLYQMASGITTDALMAHPEMTNSDKESVKLHGYRAKTINDIFLPPGMSSTKEKGTSSVFSSAGDMAALYWEWYKINHTLRAGTFTLHLRPDIKAGHGLLVPQLDGTTIEYLVEQVSHQCAWGGKPIFTTALQVTRGQKHA